MSQSLVTGAKEKLAANFTLFLGCFLAGLSTGPLLSWDSGVSEGGQGGAGTASETQEELESEVSFLLFTGSVFSSWFKIKTSVNTEKETDLVLRPARSIGFQFLSHIFTKNI